MKDYRDAEAAWQRARALAWHGAAGKAADLVVEVAAFYERGRFLARAQAASEALDRVVALLDAHDHPVRLPRKGVRELGPHQQFVARLIWAVLDDFQLGPGEHGPAAADARRVNRPTLAGVGGA